MKSKLNIIATHLTVQHESKKYGVYEDDKIKIEIIKENYHPNLHVYVKINGKNKLVALYNDHECAQEYHAGAWCGYVEDVLYPKALEARKQRFQKVDEEAAERERKLHTPLNDSLVFNK